MRQIVLDTETTGLEAKDGHRIIEIGAIEIFGRQVMPERQVHHYVNPDREVDAGARNVHGLDSEFLADKPRFAEIIDELLEFVRGAEVLIHNAPFDVSFLDAELARLNRPPFAQHCEKVTDTLRMAREAHPGKRNSLDALCERYGISNRHRTLHGALVDAALLADVYLAMTRGQDSLVMDLAPAARQADLGPVDAGRLVVLRADAGEIAAHESVLDSIEKEGRSACVWRRSAAGPAAAG